MTTKKQYSFIFEIIKDNLRKQFENTTPPETTNCNKYLIVRTESRINRDYTRDFKNTNENNEQSRDHYSMKGYPPTSNVNTKMLLKSI